MRLNLLLAPAGTKTRSPVSKILIEALSPVYYVVIELYVLSVLLGDMLGEFEAVMRESYFSVLSQPSSNEPFGEFYSEESPFS